MTRARLLLACLAGIAFQAFWYGPALASSTGRGVNDFLNFYTAGKLAFSGHLYDPQTFIATEASVTGYSTANLIFVRLPWQAALFWLLARLPYFPAYAVWQLLCVSALFAAFYLWPYGSRQSKLLAAAWSFPLFTSLAVGQDVPFVLLAISAAVRFRERYPVLCGICQALCVAKVHLLWIFVLVWLGWDSKPRLAAFLSTGGVLAGLCFAAGTWNWIPQFLGALRFCEQHEDLSVMPNLHRIFAAAPTLEGIAALVCAAAVFLAARKDRSLAAAAALAAGILTGRHGFIADCSILLPAAGLVAVRVPEARKALLLILVPLTYLPSFFAQPLATTLVIASLCFGSAYAALTFRGPEKNEAMR